ncbi:MAG: SMP-30/gluconolactonase/LRE family protein [Bryobacteraceae bacterium]|nr:SMP-30/gluconolactonase/LRE family protein [Bryobacteraceae bacterium]
MFRYGILALVLAVSHGAAATYTIDTAAGANDAGDGGPATAAQLGAAEGIALDSAGNLYIADAMDARVRRVDAATGRISAVAGTGHPGLAGDGGPAVEAQLNAPYDVAVDSKGNVYIADLGNARVRKVSPDGTIQTVAGGDSNTAPPATLAAPRNLLVDAAGNLYISDFGRHQIYKLSAGGKFSVHAGTGAAGYNGDGFANMVNLNGPAGLAADARGGLYFADAENRRVRSLTAGIVTTVLEDPSGALGLGWPTGVAVDREGTLYATATGAAGGVVVQALSGIARRLEGLDAVEKARDLALDAAGRLYIADGRQVWRLDGDAKLTRVAGRSSFGEADGGKATEARLLGPIGVSADEAGNVYIAEEGRQRIRKLNPQGWLATLVKTGLTDPVAVAADRRGRIWIADYAGNAVYRALPDGTLARAAGTGEAGFSGDGGSPLGAKLNRPRGVAVDPYGNVFIADSLNHRVRKITAGGQIQAIGGSGAPGYSGDLGLADRAQMRLPAGIAVDDEGNVYVAEQGNHVVRKIGIDGFIATVAGTGRWGDDGDGGPAAKARLNMPSAVAFDPEGNLLIADTGNHRVRAVDSTGVIRTIAGSGTAGFSGDGGPAEQARLRSPASITVDRAGHVYIADLENRLIRRLTPVIAPPSVETPVACQAAHGASFAGPPFAPGQIVSIFGWGFSGAGDVEVRVNGTTAYVFYAGETQVNAQLPYGVAGAERGELEVRLGGTPHCRGDFDVAAAAPGFFTTQGGAGQAVAVNRDGSLNSADNPADLGAIVVLYATGEGVTAPASASGVAAAEPFAKPALPVHVRVGGLPADVLYAGAAPGFIGLMQINVRLPAFAPTGALPVELFVGSARSQPGVTIAVR